jgi:hypothetical protein
LIEVRISAALIRAVEDVSNPSIACMDKRIIFQIEPVEIVQGKSQNAPWWMAIWDSDCALDHCVQLAIRS